ncbi:MAG TPA: GNAT family N-acetyltransferase, partial [Gaiellaceae bacterium]
GKSTALAALRERGFATVDTDEEGWTEWSDEDGGYLWREERIAELLARELDSTLFVSGTVSNQGRFRRDFDAVVLLSAPVDVLLRRIENRSTNDYGKRPEERALIVQHVAEIEPLLRASCTHELDATRPVDEVVAALAAIGGGSRLGAMSLPSTGSLRELYDEQLRGVPSEVLPKGVRMERDGPLLRYHGFEFGGFIEYRDLGGLDGAALDELIARQVQIFAEAGERFEWKHHGHDLPADLPDRLRAAGFVPEDTETVVIAQIADIAAEPQLPEGVSLREVATRADFERIAALQTAVWNEDNSGFANFLQDEHEVDPDGLVIVVAEAGEEVVCAAWVRFPPGTVFATFWGGATLEAWRGRGIYRALVAYRAALAAERGLRYVEVDASDDSRPILERLGFVPVTTTTPYIWSPPPLQQ